MDNRGSIPGRGRVFLFATVSGPALGPIQRVPEALSAGVKRPGREVDPKNRFLHTRCNVRRHRVVYEKRVRSVKVRLTLYNASHLPLRCSIVSSTCLGRPQWPHDITNLWSRTVPTLGSWVRIVLQTWMRVRVFLYCAVLCRWRPCVGPIPHPRSPTSCLFYVK
jgi:hypothetical protein